jgi:hypothetical protein
MPVFKLGDLAVNGLSWSGDHERTWKKKIGSRRQVELRNLTYD